MGFSDFVDDLGDSIEDGVENAVEGLGRAADAGLDLVSEGADAIGLDGAAEALDDLGDNIASGTGGDVGEEELGETEDPKELIRGEPAEIGSTADTLQKFASSIDATGQALKKIDSSAWTGAGADAFNAVYDKQPKLWFDGADAMNAASHAMTAWHNEVKAAQDKATDAIEWWKAADAEERRQKTWWNSLTAEQQSQTTLVDTWSSMRTTARELLRRARTQRDNGASIAVGAFSAATEKAPKEPPFTDRWMANLSDLGGVLEHGMLNFYSGLLTSFTGLVQFVRQVNPTDIYNMTHPAEYMTGLADLGTGLVVAVADPGATVSAILSDARRNPFEFTGALTGDLLLTAATGGGGGAKTAINALKRIKDAGRTLDDAGRVGRHLPTNGTHSPIPTREMGGPHNTGTTPEGPSAGPAHTDPTHTPSNTHPLEAGRQPDSPAPRAEDGGGHSSTPDHPRHSDPPASHGHSDDSPSPEPETPSHTPDSDTPPHRDPGPEHGPDPDPSPSDRPDPDPAPQQRPDPDPTPDHRPDPDPDPRPEHRPDQNPDPRPEHRPDQDPTPGDRHDTGPTHRQPEQDSIPERRTEPDPPRTPHVDHDGAPRPDHSSTPRSDPDRAPASRPDSDTTPTPHVDSETTPTRTDPDSAPHSRPDSPAHADTPTSRTDPDRASGPDSDTDPANTSQDPAFSTRPGPDHAPTTHDPGPSRTGSDPAPVWQQTPGAHPDGRAPQPRSPSEAPPQRPHSDGAPSSRISDRTPASPTRADPVSPRGQATPSSPFRPNPDSSPSAYPGTRSSPMRTDPHSGSSSRPHSDSPTTRPDPEPASSHPRSESPTRTRPDSRPGHGPDDGPNSRPPRHDSDEIPDRGEGRSPSRDHEPPDRKPPHSDRNPNAPGDRTHDPDRHAPRPDRDTDTPNDRTRDTEHPERRDPRPDRDPEAPRDRTHNPHRDTDNPARHDPRPDRDPEAPRDRAPDPDDTRTDRDTGPDDDKPPRDPEDSTPEDRARSDAHAHEQAQSDGPEVDRTPGQKTCSEDPVDISTGEFLLPETDLALPGVLPLELRRAHHSNFRFGRWFGPSWSATLDVRIVVEDEGVTFLGEDGVMLAYPHSEVDVPVRPLTEGQRWTLTRTDSGGYRVRDQRREIIWHFAPELGLDGIEARLGNFAISAITDRHHNRVRFRYDSDGVPVEVTHSGGYRVRIESARGRVTGLSLLTHHPELGEFAQPLYEFGYNAGDLVSVTNADGATTRYTYDAEHRMTSWTDSNGNRMLNTYDESGRVIHQRGTAGILNSDFDYLEFPDGTGRLTTVTDSHGATTTHGFDRELQLRDLVTPDGGRTHIDYNTDRRPLAVVAPDGTTTTYLYNEAGDPAKITRPDGNSIAIDYLWRNRPTAITAPDGSVERREWSEDGDLAATIDASGARTELTYHPNGALATITESTGARTVVHVDEAGLPVRLVDPLGSETRIERDAAGRPIRIIDAAGSVTRYDWSPAGKLVRRTDPDGYAESWSYDGEGNTLTHTDRAGGVTGFAYGAFDLVDSRTDADGSVTRYAWDTERRLAAVHNPLGQSWTYEYDTAGRLIAETDYTGATTHYTHDRAGRTATVTSTTGTTRHHRHDVLGRLTEITTDAGEWIRYTYDPADRILTADNGTGADPTHALAFTYTTTGSIETEQVDTRPPTHYEYDPHGRRIRRITPSGADTGWHRDITGRVDRLTADGHDVTFDYDPLGQLTSWRTGEIAVARELDNIGRVTRQEVTAFPTRALSLDLGPSGRPGPRRIRHDEFTFRPDGYLTTHTTTRPETTPLRRAYTLDPIGRVTTVAHNDRHTENYTYDPLSNITSAVTEQSTSTAAQHRSESPNREYRNNLLIRDGRTRYHYDAAGRLIRKTTTRLSRKPDIWHYRYNSFDQLTDVYTPDHQWWHYTYDALGRRTTKQHLANDSTLLERIDYVWDGTNLVEQVTADTTTRWHYQPGSYTPLTQTIDQAAIDSEFYAIVTDLIGAPTELVDPDAARTVATASNDLWGRTTWTGSTVTPLRFPGQFHDPETGLHYNLHRVYDPAVGRFLTQDPLGLAPAPNPAAYPHNPLVWNDPLGLVPGPCEYHDGELPDSEKLGRRMRADKDNPQHPESDHDQAHHIVPGAIRYGGAPDARAILKQFEIKINDPANGVWLPDHRGVMGPDDIRIPHHGGDVHSKANLQVLTDLLRAETTREGVIDVLRQVAEVYKSGGNLIP
ncbi:putative T7SS-secreted protein [Nocardia sp. BMG51109]|uniref:putative T7SS-secreted protein n=1 Tax=Nocardia sp. BMG51109 TaxID=1056816 RepID=UPI000467657D|nr:DUF6531 domain-containing protein [Nocardia sp. BMG51109]